MGIDLPHDKIAALCGKWRITEFALFGSVLRDDFGPESDVDVLLTFDPDAPWTLWDIVDLQDELRKLFGREVDIVEKNAIRNPVRKRNILSSYQVVYAA